MALLHVPVLSTDEILDKLESLVLSVSQLLPSLESLYPDMLGTSSISAKSCSHRLWVICLQVVWMS